MNRIFDVHNFLTDYKIIFWDFDGVIKDSVFVKGEAFIELFNNYDEKIKDRIFNHHLENGGTSRNEKILIYMKWCGIKINQDNINFFLNKFSKIVKEKVINSVWILGCQETLVSFQDSIINILITATPLDEIEEILEELKIKKIFQKIYGGEVTKKEAIRNSLCEFKSYPEEAILIGDSEKDFIAAKHNKISFILRKASYNQNLISKNSLNYIENFL